MGLKQGNARMWAVLTAAAAAMALCFAREGAAMGPLDPLPYRPPAVLQAAEDAVDINTAGLEGLMSLPGIGEARARAILDDRAANGPFRYPEDLIRVPGIGEGILAGISGQITTGGNHDAEDFSG